MTRKPFSIVPKDRKLLKSSRVRKYLREVERITKEEMEKNGTAWWSKDAKTPQQ